MVNECGLSAEPRSELVADVESVGERGAKLRELFTASQVAGRGERASKKASRARRDGVLGEGPGERLSCGPGC